MRRRLVKGKKKTRWRLWRIKCGTGRYFLFGGKAFILESIERFAFSMESGLSAVILSVSGGWEWRSSIGL